ncbi:hypothetical protein AAFF_G00196900 [Aldrovandia affinis]|uniref:Uncharacterized protein n=1 Tax=Aldrovandia affinis TaxID=143900 RepID=A0AAD7W5V3_9TELE|nr:hypothetical protein AAFF_G00196900 [Aldrovandia affinis]
MFIAERSSECLRDTRMPSRAACSHGTPGLWSGDVKLLCIVATGSWDYTVKVWNLRTEERETTLEGHRGNVTSLCFSVTGMLASGSWDGTVRVWLPTVGSAIFVLEGHRAWVRTLAFSRDGLVLASAAENDMVRIWDMSTGKCIKRLQGHKDSALGCTFTPAELF